MLKNVAFIQIQKVAICKSDRKKFNSKQLIQILQPFVIDYFSSHLYIVAVSLCPLSFFANTHFNKFLGDREFLPPPPPGKI